jgi:hypothetical protein
MKIARVEAKGKSQGKQPRVAVAIEPDSARLLRMVAKAEGMELSELLDQALIAWIRKWRPEWVLKVKGAEGPEPRTEIRSLQAPGVHVFTEGGSAPKRAKP